MKQKGLCRALLLILFATCAVAGQAQEVLRSDSVKGVDAGKESLEIKPSASEVTPEKVAHGWSYRTHWWPIRHNGLFAPLFLHCTGTVPWLISRQVIMVDIGAYGNCMKVSMPVWT